MTNIIAQLVAAAKDNGGEVHTVHVHCSRRGHGSSGSLTSRAIRMRKLTDPASVDRQRSEDLLFSVHPDFAGETLSDRHVGHLAGRGGDDDNREIQFSRDREER